MSRILGFFSFCSRSLFWLCATLVIALSLAILAVRYWALPAVTEQRERVLSEISSATGLTILAGGLTASWTGWEPSLQISSLRVQAKTGEPLFTVDSAEVGLSLLSLVTGRPHLSELRLVKPELNLRRDKAGAVWLGPLALTADPAAPGDQQLTEWLLDQPSFALVDARLSWVDETLEAPPLTLDGLTLRMDKRRGHHRVALTGKPDLAVATRLMATADLQITRAKALASSKQSALNVRGVIFAQAEGVDAALLRRHLPRPPEGDLFSAKGTVRAWLDIDTADPTHALRQLTTDVALTEARLQMGADLPPLELDRLKSRVIFQNLTQGFRLATEGLTFSSSKARMPTPADFSLALFRDGGADVTRGELRAKSIDLAAVTHLLDFFPADRTTKKQVASFAPRGQLKLLTADWSGAGAALKLALKGELIDVSLESSQDHPGVNNLTARFEGNELKGRYSVDQMRAFHAPALFQSALNFDHATALGGWTRAAAVPGVAAPPLEVQIEQLSFDSADTAGEAKGIFRTIPSATHATPGYVELSGSFSRGEANRIWAYLPNGLQPTREWLKGALTAGKLDKTTWSAKGDLWHFPFENPAHGFFKVETRLVDGSLRYLPDWPAATAVQGAFMIDSSKISMLVDSAKIFESKVEKVSAVLPNIAQFPLQLLIEGESKTNAKELYRFLRESPLKEGPGRFTDAIAIEGPGELDLKLTLQLGGGTGSNTRINGRYKFAANQATIGPNIRLSDAKGEVTFTEAGVAAREIVGNLFGYATRVRIATPRDSAILTEVDGRIDAKSLHFLLAAPLLAPLSGTVDWQARLTTQAGSAELQVDSQLVGLTSDHPAPLAKKADEKWPLAVVINDLATAKETISVKLAERFDAQIKRKQNDKGESVLTSAFVTLGQTPRAPPAELPPGIVVSGNVAFLDFDRWREATKVPANPTKAAAPGAPSSAPAPAAGLDLAQIDLAMGRIRFFGRDYVGLSAKMAREGAAGWRGTLSSPDIEGVVGWDGAAFNGRGALEAKFKRFNLLADAPPTLPLNATPAAAPNPNAVEPSLDDPELPGLDIVADEFKFRGQWLGRLEFFAKPLPNEWRLDRIAITNGHAKLEGQGAWRKAARPITTLNLKADSENLNALFAQFGHGDTLKRGKGKLSGVLSWPGYPHDFALNQLYGDFRLDWEKGQFAKLDPGVGKLIGLMSLQSLPRRFSFDFRDVFSDGFAFDSIKGDVKMARGTLLTDNFEISGPAAFVSLNGEVSLPYETQNLKVRIVPEVGEGIAIAAGIIGTPVIGLTTYLVQKLLQNPIAKIVAYEYQVTGNWDTPVVGKPESSKTPPSPSLNR